MKKLFLVISISICISHFIFYEYYKVTTVDGVSMRPNISDKQSYFYFNDFYKNNHINRGDIVFINVKNKDYYRVKRVVGLPDDIIEMNKGILIINEIPKTIDKELEMNIYEEKINKSKSYKILNVSKNDEEDNFNKIKIPHGFYFVLGDNREDSLDSREFGLISKKDILHKLVTETHFIYHLSGYFFTLSNMFK